MISYESLHKVACFMAALFKNLIYFDDIHPQTSPLSLFSFTLVSLPYLNSALSNSMSYMYE